MIRIPGQPGRDLCDTHLGITRRDLHPYTLFPDGDDLDMTKMNRVRVEDLKLRPDVFAQRARFRRAIRSTPPSCSRRFITRSASTRRPIVYNHLNQPRELVNAKPVNSLFA